jgi:hypothetical protein
MLAGDYSQIMRSRRESGCLRTQVVIAWRKVIEIEMPLCIGTGLAAEATRFAM